MNAIFNTRVLLLTAIMLYAASGARGELIGLWSFDGNALDSSGKGNHGTLQNGAGFSVDTPPLFGGQSLNVAGGTQHVLVPHHPSLDVTGEITIAAWIKPSMAGAGWDGILAKSPSSNGSAANHAGNYELRVENTSRRLTFLYQQGGVNDTGDAFSVDAVVNSGAWQHVAVTSAAGVATFYVNGAAVGVADPGTATFGAINTNPLYIGSRADLFTVMDGLMDEVGLWNHALSPAEIQQLASGPVIPEPSTLVLAGLGLVSLWLGSRRPRPHSHC